MILVYEMSGGGLLEKRIGEPTGAAQEPPPEQRRDPMYAAYEVALRMQPVAESASPDPRGTPPWLLPEALSRSLPGEVD